MSTLFDEAIHEFDVTKKGLISPEEADAEPDLLKEKEEDIPVTAIAGFAVRSQLEHPERKDWSVIPLHARKSVELTDNYIACIKYEDARGVTFLTREEGGSPEDVNRHQAESFSRTELAHRIKFWHADYRPPEYPEYYSYPIDEREPPTREIDIGELRQGMEEHIEGEMEIEKNEGIDKKRDELYSSSSSFPELTSNGLARGSDRTFRLVVDMPEDDSHPDTFQYLVDEHGIHKGNHVLIGQPGAGSEPEYFPLEAVLEEIHGASVDLRIKNNGISTQTMSKVSRHLSNKRRGFRITPILNPLPYERKLTAVRSVMKDDDKGKVLCGKKDLTFGDPRALEEEHDTDLNQEQEMAARLSLLSDEMFCLHGPPGTGKTRTLVEVIRRAANSGQRVLVSADSNQAADNILVGSSTRENADPDSLYAYDQHGEGEFVARRLNTRRSQRGLVREEYSGEGGDGDVVVATNSRSSKVPSNFDIAVIDEATQSTMASTCIPISKADRFILAGDHKQLPPYTADEGPVDSQYVKSMFEHLYDEDGVYEGVGVQLRTQYRMHRDIMYFPNKHLYDESLRCGKNVPPLPNLEAVEGYDVGGDVHETERFSRYNPTEIKVLVKVLSQLIGYENRAGDDSRLEAEEVGIITPYEAQRRKIIKVLGDHDEMSDVIVDTVDSFQGSEREAILISMVRSNPEGRIGFLGRQEDGPRRLNVAITRARRYCGIVGDWHTLSMEREGKCDRLYSDLEKYLRDTGRMRSPDPDLL